MKFNVITALWTLSIMLMCFNISIIFIDWSFTTTLVYHFAVLLNGFIFGVVFNEWCQ